jgi:hypothetical protein
MSQLPASLATGFTTPEREFIRREFDQHFGSYPLVAEDILLHTWRGWPAGRRAEVAAARQDNARAGIFETSPRRPVGSRLCAAAASMALREFAANRRHLDPVRYAHIRCELGLEFEEGSTSFSV